MNAGKRTSLIILLIAAGLAPALMGANEYYLHIYIICAINIILAASLRTVAVTGQMSIGQAGFMAVGAYASAILAKKFGVPVSVAMIAGGLAAMVLAGLIGYPLSRVRSIYFVMVTMFLGEIIRLALFELRGLTGGSTGMMAIPRPGVFSFFGFFQVNFADRLTFCYLMLAVLLAVLLVLYNIERSPLGSTLAAVGQDEAVSSSVGVNVAAHKIMIFCIGSFFTGLAGGLYAHYMTVLNPDTFNIFTSLYILIYVVVGGRSFFGPIVGAVVLTLIPEVFGSLKEYQPFVFALALFLVVFLLPGGLAGLPAQLEPWTSKLLKRRVSGAGNN